jgi:hypothetical protein
MKLDRYIDQLAHQAQIILSLTQDVSAEQAIWKPAVEAWSILEVVNHLYDEEREDFRAHLETVLTGPDTPWAPIDPQGWVTQRRYNERDLGQSLVALQEERTRSLAWLRGLGSIDGELAYSTPWGSITAGDLLASWVAHDLLHIRQLVELRWHYMVNDVAPYQVVYAGQW